MHAIIWIIMLTVFILIEILTLRFTTIWFAGGALTAFIISLFYDSLILEIIIFLAVSIALWYFTRPIVIRCFCSGNTRNGYDGVIGKKAMVIVTVDKGKGTGKVDVDGQEWSAKSLDGGKLETGCRVIVKGISGTKLIVHKNTD